MSQYAPPPDYSFAPPLHGGPPTSPGGRAPSSIKVLSILAIVFGSAAVLCNAFGLIAQAMMFSHGGQNPLTGRSLILDIPGMQTYATASVIIHLGFSIVLLAGGVGGLRFRPLARKMMVRWAMALLCWVVFNLLMNLIWIGPATIEVLEERSGRQAIHSALVLGVTGGTIFYAVVSSILPLAFLICWRSPKVVAAFESGEFSDTVSIPMPPTYYMPQA